MLNRLTGIIGLILLSPLLLILSLIILIEDGWPVLYVQKRPGQNNVLFRFFKFRSMKNETPEVATHLLGDPDKYLLKFGKLMRKLSLDELPNLLNVIRGEMVFVGPRPALYNQDDLISLRTEIGIHKLKPGITGWAQINGRDELSIREKVKFDKFYLENKSIRLDIKILLLTLLKVVKADGVTK